MDKQMFRLKAITIKSSAINLNRFIRCQDFINVIEEFIESFHEFG